jgi:ferredoxin
MTEPNQTGEGTRPEEGASSGNRPIGRVMAQVAMVMNLDKCIGCHTCSVTCKQAWTNRGGVEYAWFNNVETRPGQGYPRTYQDQEKWKGGWVRRPNGKLVPRMNSPEAKEFTRLWIDMIQRAGPRNWTTYTWYEVGNDLGAGASGMIFDSIFNRNRE